MTLNLVCAQWLGVLHNCKLVTHSRVANILGLCTLQNVQLPIENP